MTCGLSTSKPSSGSQSNTIITENNPLEGDFTHQSTTMAISTSSEDAMGRTTHLLVTCSGSTLINSSIKAPSLASSGSVISKSRQLQRWGHSSDVYNDNIFITCGRVSPQQDSSQTFVFDTKAATLIVYQTEASDRPKPRRRHSSIVIGNSLLIYGGYNGKYLQHFDYLQLKPLQKENQSQINLKITDNTQQIVQYLGNVQRQIQTDIFLRITQNSKTLMHLRSNRQLISTNDFFKQIVKEECEDQFQINLPDFSDLLAFRIIHSCIIKKTTALSKMFTQRFYENLLRSMQYFCSVELQQTVEQNLLQKLDINNSQYLFNIAFQFGLNSLKNHAAKNMLVVNEKVVVENNKRRDIISSFQSLTANEDNLIVNIEKRYKNLYHQEQSRQFLLHTYFNLQFQLSQKKIREQKTSIFSKAASTIKNILNSGQTSKTPQSLNQSTDSVEHNKLSCFTRIINFISSVCSKAKADIQQHQN